VQPRPEAAKGQGTGAARRTGPAGPAPSNCRGLRGGSRPSWAARHAPSLASGAAQGLSEPVPDSGGGSRRSRPV